jgi:hypothetical protein
VRFRECSFARQAQLPVSRRIRSRPPSDTRDVASECLADRLPLSVLRLAIRAQNYHRSICSVRYDPDCWRIGPAHSVLLASVDYSMTTCNQPMQRIAIQPPTHFMNLCHPPLDFESRFTGLPVADLESRQT